MNDYAGLQLVIILLNQIQLITTKETRKWTEMHLYQNKSIEVSTERVNAPYSLRNKAKQLVGFAFFE